MIPNTTVWSVVSVLQREEIGLSMHMSMLKSIPTMMVLLTTSQKTTPTAKVSTPSMIFLRVSILCTFPRGLLQKSSWWMYCPEPLSYLLMFVNSGDQPSIAVVWGLYDKVEDNLNRLGIEHTFYDDASATAMFDNLEVMETYDIIFINCGSNADEDNAYHPQRIENIKTYVRNGGSIYASDYASTSISLAFPNAVNFIGRGGHVSDVHAHIHDSTMQTILESTSVTIDYHN